MNNQNNFGESSLRASLHKLWLIRHRSMMSLLRNRNMMAAHMEDEPTKPPPMSKEQFDRLAGKETDDEDEIDTPIFVASDEKVH